MTHFTGGRVNLRFVYCFCRDIGSVRRFYTELLGMSELGCMDTEEFGWVGYDSQGMQLMFFRWDDGPDPAEGWAWQPGDGAGELPLMSFSVEIPGDECEALVAAVRDAGLETMTGVPTWRQESYWGWTVRDPAGNTVELYWHPEEKPGEEKPVWREG
jgi:hypothetical protein